VVVVVVLAQLLSNAPLKQATMQKYRVLILMITPDPRKQQRSAEIKPSTSLG